MTDVNRLEGDVRILALTVQALIETHPDKALLHKTLIDLIDHPEKSSLYSPEQVTTHSGTLLRDLIRTAHSKAEIPVDKGISPSQSS